MTDEPHSDTFVLFDLASSFDSLREHLQELKLGNFVTALGSASDAMEDFTVLLAELTDEVRSRADAPHVSPDQPRTIAEFTRAAAATSRAMNQFAEAYEAIGIHHQFADLDNADLRESREAARQVILERVDSARDALVETTGILRRRAEELLPADLSPRASAARARTTGPTALSPNLPASPPAPGSATIHRLPGHGR